MHIFSNEFKKLAILKQQSESWIDLEIIRLKDELDFYFSIFDFTFKVAREKKIDYSYPKVAAVPRYFAKKVYDVTLVAKGVNTIIPNDISFDQDDNVFFLMGANGGGKTTYLRACAVNLILFLSGCPVFCESCAACSAEIYPFRAVFTHFPTSEGYETTGRLKEEASRVNAITQHTNEVIFIFFNESFSGANETLGEKLTFETAAKIKRSKAFALFVTHFSKYGFGSFPILNAVIDEKEGNKRTFRIQRSSSREASHANDILRKYGLDSLSLAGLILAYLTIYFFQYSAKFIHTLIDNNFKFSVDELFHKLFMWKAYNTPQTDFLSPEFQDVYSFVGSKTGEISIYINSIFRLIFSNLITLGGTVALFAIYEPWLIIYSILVFLSMLLLNRYIVNKGYELDKTLIREKRSSNYYRSLLTEKNSAKELRIHQTKEHIYKKWLSIYEALCVKQLSLMLKNLLLSKKLILSVFFAGSRH